MTVICDLDKITEKNPMKKPTAMMFNWFIYENKIVSVVALSD
jgi:hypothetical protein